MSVCDSSMMRTNEESVSPISKSGPDRKPFHHGSGRLELAEAIASRDNPLTAR